MMSSVPTNFDGRGRLIAFRKCESETGAIGKESPDEKSVAKLPMLQFLETRLKCAAKDAAASHGGSDVFHQYQFEWDFFCRFS